MTCKFLIAPCDDIKCVDSSTCCGPTAITDLSIVPRIIGGTLVTYQLNQLPALTSRQIELVSESGICLGLLSDGARSYSLMDELGRCILSESGLVLATPPMAPVMVRLEYSRAGTKTADDWCPVTNWAADTGQLLDPVHRDAGWYLRTYYRVAVRGANGTLMYSPAISGEFGGMNPGQLRLYRKIVTSEQRRYNDRATPARRGTLLKVRYYGQQCTECYDEESGKVFKHDCNTCFGVGYTLGYYPPVPCFFAEYGPISDDLQITEEMGTMVEGRTTTMRFLNIPAVHPWDVWVDDGSDHRFIIGGIQPMTSFGPLDVVCRAAVGRLSFDHPVYRINVK